MRDRLQEAIELRSKGHVEERRSILLDCKLREEKGSDAQLMIRHC
jgi:hypothetical protein